MSTGLTHPDDSGSCSPGSAFHLMAETATWLASLSEASSDHHSNISFQSLPESPPNDLSQPSSPGVVVFCLASVFFSMSLALFAICTGLVDIDLRLEDKYIRYILFIDRICNHAIKMVDIAGEAFLVVPCSGCIDAVVSFSRATLDVPAWALQILDQRIRLLHHYGVSIVNLVYVARLSIRDRAFTVCASSRELVKQLCRTVLRATRCSTMGTARTCVLLGARWIYARGRSLPAVICAATTRAVATAVRLPSGRIYSRAWSVAMRPRVSGPTPYRPAVDQLHQGEAVLTWYVHSSESPSPCKAVNAHSEMSLNITLDLDVDEDGDLRVAFVPEASTQDPTVTLRVLCDAETQTEDYDPEAKDPEVPMEEADVGVSLAGLEDGGDDERKNLNSLALTLGRGAHTTPSMNSHVPASATPVLTSEFNPAARSFALVDRVSPSSRRTADGPCDKLSDARLGPLTEEFKVLALSNDAFLGDALASDVESDGCCCVGDAADVLPPHGKLGTEVPMDVLSPLPLDILTFAPVAVDSGGAMAQNGGRRTG